MARHVFILGATQRTGTNFLQDLLLLHPACRSAAPVNEDFLLHSAHLLEAYTRSVDARWDRGWGIDDALRAHLLRSLGDGLLRFLAERAGTDAGIVVSKTPSVANLPLFFELFPEASALLLMRDGRAVVESQVRSFRIAFQHAATEWTQAARMVREFVDRHPPDRFACRLLRYEDLFESLEDTLTPVLGFLGLDVAGYDFAAAHALPVRGSSVFRGEQSQVHWTPVAKTDAFRPLERWQHWAPAQHRAFAQIAGDMLERFGYAPAPALAATGGSDEIPASHPRNAPCPCGSGKRFKECHGAIR